MPFNYLQPEKKAKLFKCHPISSKSRLILFTDKKAHEAPKLVAKCAIATQNTPKKAIGIIRKNINSMITRKKIINNFLPTEHKNILSFCRKISSESIDDNFANGAGKKFEAHFCP